MIRHNIEALLDDKGLKLICRDATFQLYAEVDEINNLACAASSIRYQFDRYRRSKPVCKEPSMCSGSHESDL